MSALGPIIVTSEEFEGEASSIDEFLASGAKTLNDLRIKATGERNGHSVRVWIDPRYAHVTGTRHDHLVAGVQIKVEQILRSRQHRFARMCGLAGYPAMAGGLMALALDLAVGSSSSALRRAAWPSEIGAGVVVVLGVIAVVIGRTVRGQILLDNRENRPSWFVRNRDALFVQVLVGVLILGLGYVLGKA